MSGEDFCEYVYNPLMRQYQAMIRLMNMLRNSQDADCNDIQCFTTDDPTNPMNSFNSPNNQMSFFTTYGPMILVWALFMFALVMFRPNSMRKNKVDTKKNDRNQNDHVNNRFLNGRDNDDDDNSTVS